ncbi:recombination directionality factor [Streptomyces sp. IBSNAI001]|uniref:recombination directionality factor n=1 Tax=Streptomyces sp. IBSNAI001 TaxID=3457499 RepID=UPI003FD4F61E
MANNLRSIFETDPDAKPRPKQNFANDVVGRFRSGRLVGKQPESLNEWRVTTGDPAVADVISRLMGGETEEWDTDKEDNLQVLTTSKSVEIIIDSSDAIDASMKKFGFSGLEHHCDGVKFLSDDDPTLVGESCGCPPMLEDRKARAKSGKGPKPSIDLTFKLAANPEIGKFRFNSGGWSLVNVLHEVIEAIDTVGGRQEDTDGKVTDPGKPVRATLTIEHVAYTTKSGRDVAYNMPVIKVTGVYEAAQPVDLPAAA